MNDEVEVMRPERLIDDPQLLRLFGTGALLYTIAAAIHGGLQASGFGMEWVEAKGFNYKLLLMYVPACLCAIACFYGAWGSLHAITGSHSAAASLKSFAIAYLLSWAPTVINDVWVTATESHWTTGLALISLSFFNRYLWIGVFPFCLLLAFSPRWSSDGKAFQVESSQRIET